MEAKPAPLTFSKVLRIIVHIGGLAPVVYLVWDYYSGNLGLNPIEAVIRRTGRAAIILLLLSLTCTPIHTLFNAPPVRKLRKPLGLYAALYAGLHFAAFALWDYGLDFNLIWRETVEKPFILVGMAALLILFILTITSHRYWRRKLGRGWVILHRSVYLAAILAVAHHLLAIKGDLLSLQGNYTLPMIAGAFLIVLFLLRLPFIYKPLRQSMGRG